MHRRSSILLIVFLSLCSGIVAGLLETRGHAAAMATTNALTGKTIMERVIALSGRTKDQLILTNYHFVRWEVSEELDKKGATTKRQEKIYDHSPVKGFAVLREIRENGKTIPKTEAESRGKPEDRERPNKSGRGGGRSVELTDDLIKRFEFELLGTTNLNGHTVYSIRFTPAAKQESPKNMNDKVLQKIRGNLLVETNSFQIARLEAELFDDLSFWGGMLGSLSEFRLLLIREPVDGIWFNRVITGEFEARAVLNSMHGRFASTNSNFQKRELVPSLKATPAK